MGLSSQNGEEKSERRQNSVLKTREHLFKFFSNYRIYSVYRVMSQTRTIMLYFFEKTFQSKRARKCNLKLFRVPGQLPRIKVISLTPSKRI